MKPADSRPRLVSATNAYPLHAPIWRGTDGALLDIDFTPRLDPAEVASRPATLWRYREALPLADDAEPVTLGEALTPLVALEFAGRQVWIKQEQLFPTGSYKDRGAALLISHARAIGVRAVVEDSSGNAGSAIAAYCARAGLGCTIFVPDTTSADKLTQIRAYGATLQLIAGSREDTAAAVLAAAETTYYASHSWNPFFFHGTKTFAYELVEQLGWRAPDAVVLPAGNGTLLLGADIGFRELRAMGLIDRLPRLIAVQAAHCAPLAAAFLRRRRRTAAGRNAPHPGRGGGHCRAPARRANPGRRAAQRRHLSHRGRGGHRHGLARARRARFLC